MEGYSLLYKEINNLMVEDNYTNKAITYPRSDEYEYITRLKTINFDERRIHDILHNKAFVVAPATDIKKDVKSIDSIFSSRFGNSLKDLNPYIDRYKCDCGNLKSRINDGVVCPDCQSKVRFIDDDFSYCAYLVLKKYYIIHPNIYKKLERIFNATVLENMIKYVDAKDQDGHTINNINKPIDEPYLGIGMIDFCNRFDEIFEYYCKKSKKKEEYIKNIKEDYDKIFTQSIHVYTTHLRPVDINTNTLSYESTNDKYYMMTKLVGDINNDSVGFKRKKKPKNNLLYDLQMKWNSLYDDLVKIISGKKGNFRGLFGGRCNFSGRNVIVQNAALDIDQITLSYYSLIELLQQRIINILQKCYNIGYSQAYNIWYSANLTPDKRVIDVIESLIRGSYYELGLPVIINRNPTIAFGGILQVFVVGMTFDHTMGVSLRTLKLYKGDFDGDVENLFLIINKDFLELSFMIFNPRNSMMISRNDGKFNLDTANQRDTIINANTIMRMSRSKYTKEELDQIRSIKGIVL